MKLDINHIFKQAITANNQGELKKAANLYNTILQAHPTHLSSNHNLGVVLEAMGRLEEAASIYKKVILLKPDLVVTHVNLGGLLFKLGKANEAEESINNALKLDPSYTEAHNKLGIILNQLNKTDEAEASFKKSIELKPENAEAYNNLGILLSKLGRFNEAELNYKKAIELRSDYVMAHYNLSILKKFNKEDEQFNNMKNLFSNQSLNNEQLCFLNFALAKASEDLNQFDKSFRYYSNGNLLRKKMLNYDINLDIKQFDLIKKTHLNIKRKSLHNIKKSTNPKPIFILGMPRSGTTIIEQIISSHSEVLGAGELNYFNKFAEDLVTGKSTINDKTLIYFRETYLQELKKISREKSLVTDKMPGNFRFIGLICSIFPEAKIIHVKRNPAAVCWGNFKSFFKKRIEGYNNDLNNTVIYYKLYEDLMQFWEKLYSDQIYNLNYESLTTNQENETRKLIQYLDLDWQDECLAPQNNKRVVHTASNVQVREKIYQNSSKMWKNFKPYLNGIFDQFEN
jgi:Flp pilus assembly protein TadD